MDTVDDADVVVIGSGVAGALVGAKLANAGHRVLVLEAGDERPRLDLVGEYAVAAIKGPGSPYIDNTSLVPSPKDEHDPYFDQTDTPAAFKSTYERRVGGSTWHWLGNCPRHLPPDLTLRSTHGVGVDWPLSYAMLEPWYSQAEAELGVSGDHEAWDGLFGAIRSAPFPMSQIWPSYGEQWIAEQIDGVEIDGVTIRPISTPQARNSQPYEGRPACAGNSSCVPICPIQAKYDATVHLARITGTSEVRHRCVVTDLSVDTNGVITDVIYRPWQPGTSPGDPVRVKGRIVVLAGNAIETPRLLLFANGGAGIANRSDQVGRNLMDHLQGEVVARAPVPVFPFRGPPTTLGIDGFREGPWRASQAAFRISLGNDGGGRTTSVTSVLERLLGQRLIGKALRAALEDQITRLFRFSYSTEVLPSPDNRVTLSDGPRDPFGVPHPKITFHLADYNRTAFARAKLVIGHLFAGFGATDIHTDPDPNGYVGAGHIMGTTRMGDDPKISVVDRDLRTHDHPNLFIVGAGAFPTAGTANPTLTIAALALRAANTIAAELAANMSVR